MEQTIRWQSDYSQLLNNHRVNVPSQKGFDDHFCVVCSGDGENVWWHATSLYHIVVVKLYLTLDGFAFCIDLTFAPKPRPLCMNMVEHVLERRPICMCLCVISNDMNIFECIITDVDVVAVSSRRRKNVHTHTEWLSLRRKMRVFNNSTAVFLLHSKLIL